MKAAISSVLGALLVGALAACGGSGTPSEAVPVFHPDENPAAISDWQLMNWSSGALELNEGVVPYDLNSPLFTDYAHKLRTIWVPADADPAAYRASDYPDFPVGTVISKTFYYPKGEAEGSVLKAEDPIGRLNPILETLDQVRLMETRLLVRRDVGWEAVSYVWNEEQTDAKLTKIGDAQALTLINQDGAEQEFTYIVPDINQCAGCHAPNNTSREIAPLGVRPRHINKDYRHDGQAVNQLQNLQLVGYLSGYDATAPVVRNADWSDPSAPIDARARSYLDINCSHCHNPVGPADTSGLDLTMEASTGPELGVCKLPIAAGSGTGGRAFSIVPGAPDESILVHRLETTKPGAMMPELGRALSHQEGVELIRAWITEMDGACAS
ncbi:MAG: SO2930 family diheme c-type cytochrome [Henriciella sp.]